MSPLVHCFSPSGNQALFKVRVLIYKLFTFGHHKFQALAYPNEREKENFRDKHQDESEIIGIHDAQYRLSGYQRVPQRDDDRIVGAGAVTCEEEGLVAGCNSDEEDQELLETSTLKSVRSMDEVSDSGMSHAKKFAGEGNVSGSSTPVGGKKKASRRSSRRSSRSSSKRSTEEGDEPKEEEWHMLEQVKSVVEKANAESQNQDATPQAIDTAAQDSQEAEEVTVKVSDSNYQFIYSSQ